VDPRNYNTSAELSAVMDAEKVPAASALLKAAQNREKELLEEARDKAGNEPAENTVNRLVEARGLRWLINYPEKIRNKLREY